MIRKNFVLDSTSLKIKEALNKDFLEIELFAIAEGKNVNNSIFTLASMEKSIPTFYNKFILGYFNTRTGTQEGNFEEHNADIKYDSEYDEYYYSYTAPNAEKALGIIRESDKIEIVEVDGKKWIKLTAAILTKYNREAVKHLLKSKRKRKVSVEITIEDWYEDEEGFEVINAFTLDGITILGNRKNSNVLCEEGIKGAHLNILNFLETEVFSAQKKALSFAYSNLDAENKNEQKDEIEMKQNQEEMEGKPMAKEMQQDYEDTFVKNEVQPVEQSNTSENLEEIFADTNIQEDNSQENVEVKENNYSEVDNNEVDDESNCDCENKEEHVCNRHNENTEESSTEEDTDEDCSNKEDCSEVEENKENECTYEEETNEEKQNSEEETKQEEESANQAIDGEIYLEEAFEVECSFGKVVCANADIRDNLQVLITNYTQLQNDYNEIKDKYDALLLKTNNEKLLQFGLVMIANEDVLTTEDIDTISQSYTEKCNKSDFSSEEEVKNYLENQFAKIVYNKAKNNKKNEQREFTAKIPPAKVEEKKVDSFAQMKKLLNI